MFKQLFTGRFLSFSLNPILVLLLKHIVNNTSFQFNSFSFIFFYILFKEIIQINN